MRRATMAILAAAVVCVGCGDDGAVEPAPVVLEDCEMRAELHACDDGLLNPVGSLSYCDNDPDRIARCEAWVCPHPDGRLRAEWRGDRGTKEVEFFPAVEGAITEDRIDSGLFDCFRAERQRYLDQQQGDDT